MSVSGLKAKGGEGEEQGALVCFSQAFALKLGWPTVSVCLELRGVLHKGYVVCKQDEWVLLKIDYPPCATFSLSVEWRE